MTTTNFKVAVLDDYLGIAHTMAPWDTLAPAADVHFLTEPIKAEQRAQRLADYDVLVLMRERMPLPAELIRKLPKLKLVITTGQRNAGIDLAACAERNIPVLGTRSLSNITIETAWLLILALIKRLKANALTADSHTWQNALPDSLNGQTLGIVGLGGLGSQMAVVAKAFGMEVLAWSQNLTKEAAGAVGATWVDKFELLQRSDIVTLHLRLSPRTRNIIGAPELAAMKPEAFLINTSRAGLVEEQALLEALRTSRIAGAGLDVFPEEPIPADQPLLALDNVVLTPHLGYVSKQSMQIYYRDVVENIAQWQQGKLIRVVSEE